MTALAHRSYRDAMALGERIPEGQSGSWRVERRTITEHEASLGNLRGMIHGHGRYTPAGTYTGLLRNGFVIMSDVPDEMRDHAEPFRQASMRGGRVLIHGLGLGMVTQAVLSLDNVEHVDVVERSADVLALVAPSYAEDVESGRLTIHHDDALTRTWPKDARWTVAWHDIWDDICTDNLAEMTTLHRRFGRRVEWQDSWSKELCRYYRSRGR